MPNQMRTDAIAGDHIRNRNHAFFITRIMAVAVLLVIAGSVRAQQQNEPEAPKLPEKLYNGLQFALYGGSSLDVFSGGYFGGCPCDYPAGGQAFSFPYGASLNIPVFSDASLYLRLGLHKMSLDMSSGRVDSLPSMTRMGNVFSDFHLHPGPGRSMKAHHHVRQSVFLPIALSPGAGYHRV